MPIRASRTLALLLAPLALVGCVNQAELERQRAAQESRESIERWRAQSEAEEAAALEGDAGPPPDYNVRTDLLVPRIRRRLKDPDSAVIEWLPPWRVVIHEDGAPLVAWKIVALVNAKNSYGAYSGSQPWAFYVAHGHVLREEP